MKKPVLYGMTAAIVLLLGVTGLLYQKYRTTSASYASATQQEQETRNRYGAAINEIASIQDSLNGIVLGDSAINLRPSDLDAEQRLNETRGDIALARIAVLKSGIERTKDKIQQLDARLKQSGVKVAGLQKMIANLKSSVAEKETQVAALATQVDELQTKVTGLSADVEQKEGTITAQAQTIEDKRKELGTIYYMVGTKKDLTTSGVVVAEGGVLGLGKTLKPSGEIKDDLFTALDTDQETVIHLPSAKVQVLSAQPVSSYQLELVDGKMELRITDPKEFRTVKHLVVMTTA